MTATDGGIANYGVLAVSGGSTLSFNNADFGGGIRTS
jgi:hypothetical protein